MDVNIQSLVGKSEQYRLESSNLLLTTMQLHEVNSTSTLKNGKRKEIESEMNVNTHLPLGKSEQDPLAACNLPLPTTPLHERNTTSAFKGRKRKPIKSEIDVNTHLIIGKSTENHLVTSSLPLSTTPLHERNSTSTLRYGKTKEINSESVGNLDYIECNRQQKYNRYSVQSSRLKKENNEDKRDVIRGTTYLFVSDDNSTDVSFKKVQLSSMKISTTKYPTLTAIQTLQFQQTQRHMRGHACMINHRGRWKLFFVWNSSLFHLGSLMGYMYDGHQIQSKEIISLSTSKKDKNFYWVNLNENQFTPNILIDLKYPVIEENGFYYGNHTPSMIRLPEPIIGNYSKFKEIKTDHLRMFPKEKACTKLNN